MSAPGGGEFFEQFIEDYFAECEEHLSTARRVLLELERLPAADKASALARQELSRSLHTLKGLSGMVGVTSAEHVAHVLEDSLRGIERAGTRFDAGLVDTLLSGVDLLERCVAARRAGGAAPDATTDASAVLASLEELAHSNRSPAGGAVGPAATGGERRAVTYRFAFTPSPELMQRGINVETIRGRLKELGTLLDGRARVVAGGVAFDFSVAVPAGREPDPGWRDDGLEWSAIAPVAPVAPADDSSEGPRRAAPAAASVVRVELGRLDAVMRLVGDLVSTRARLDDALRHSNGRASRSAWDVVEEANALMERQLRQLREGVMRIRLVQVGEVFERLRFAVRDAARESGKQVSVELEGQGTEIDKLVVDRILEPLLHLVRNAVSHGIETAEERLAKGKPAEGRLLLRAAPSGDRILVHVEDDGAGIDVAEVETQARARGLLAPGEALDAASLLDVLCAPGFSTHGGVDRTSGRGVGMDAVRAAVRALAGELTLQTVPGRGTSFAIELPLTLMIIDAVIVEVGRQYYAVPQLVLREILQIETSSVVTFESNEVIHYRGGVLPLLSLSPLFGLPDDRRPSRYVLVIGTAAEPMGILVDRLHGLREIVVQPVVDPLVSVAGIAGATQLGDGKVSLILDSAAVLRLAAMQRQRGEPHVPRRGTAALPQSS
ncbi:MAG TPA: chemotaxis protein CheA [Gemmatimonadaceae bacterium]|nr:chemotaxis protein CheA [Gemmatimonadaceae bacterium]